jgi:hypothetical protein
VSVKAKDVTAIYGDDIAPNGYDVTGGSIYAGDSLNLGLNTIAQRGSNVGRYDINASRDLSALNGNYSITFDKGTAEITRRNVSVKAKDVTATYGDDVRLNGYDVTGGSVYGEDTLNLDLTTLAQRGSNVGRYDITASDQLADLNRNYNVTFGKGTAEITRRNVSVKASDTSSVYGNEISALSYTVTEGTTFNGQSLKVDLTTGATKGSDVKTYGISKANDLAADNPNYNINFVDGTYTITKRNITVALNKQVQYGDAIDLAGFTVTGGEEGFVRSNLSGSLAQRYVRAIMRELAVP